MSEYFVPGHFSQELQSGATHDDNSAFDAFNDVDFDAAFGDDMFLENLGELSLDQEQMPESQSNHQVQLPTGGDDLFGDQELLSRSQDAILASNTSQNGQAKGRKPREDCQPESDPNKAVNDKVGVSRHLKPSPTTDSPSHDQSLEVQRPGEHQSQDGFSEFVNEQGEVSSLDNTILENLPTSEFQNQPSLPNVDSQYDVEFNDFDELVAQDPVSNSQPGDDLTNNDETLEFQFEVFASKEWQDYANDAANRDLADILGTDTLEVPRMDHELGVV